MNVTNCQVESYVSQKFGIVTLGKIKGDLDHHTAKEIRLAFDKEIREKNPKILILDFKDVTFMDSSGIGLIIGRYKIMEELGGKILVAKAPSYIKKVLRISGVNRLAEIVEDYQEYEKTKEEVKIEEHSN